MGCNGSKAGDSAPPAAEKPASASNGSSGKLLEKYTLGKVLGQGAFGIVYSCKKKGTKEEYAVKMIDKVETPLSEIKQEAEMLDRLTHPSVVKLHDVYYEKAFVCMVMDLYKGGDMIEGMQLHWKSLGMLPISVVANVSKQMIESIAWLHQKQVVHRDVKGDNYLMDRKAIEDPQCRIFLSDFGTVRDLKEGDRLNSKCGTKTYWAPEFFAMNYGLKVDVWAIGVVMYGLVTGRFPFKGEEDVKAKKVVIPPRSSKECGELLKRILERKESERLSAEAASKHPFVANHKAQGQQEKEKQKEDMDFKPDVKETGANAGIAERRRELIDRLEDANQKPVEGVALTDLKSKPAFSVKDRQTEKVTSFEWWDAAKAKSEKVEIDFSKAADFKDDKGDESSHEELKKMLEDHAVDVSKFGTGQAKTFQEFAQEIQGGSARIMQDATQHKKDAIARVVDVVLLRITCKTKAGTKFLVKIKEQFPDGRGKVDMNQLPGTKKEPHENAMQTALRIISDRLSLKGCDIKIDFTTPECFEEDELSSSYPGMRTVYRKEIFEGQITATDATVLERIGVASDSGEWINTDSVGYTRTYKWLTEKDCKDKKVQLHANRQPGDASALVRPPVGIGEEDLTQFLKDSGIDVSKFGEDGNKTLKEFSDELSKGEASLQRQKKEDGGKVIRVVDIVVLKVTRDGKDVLVEAEEAVPTSSGSIDKHPVKWLPAVKRRPDENMFLAAHRVISKVLKVNDNFISLKPDGVKVVEESRTSRAYCGMQTFYRKRIISAELSTVAACTI